MIDIGRPEGNEPAGKLIVTIGGEERDYPIVSNVMTIGRGHASDIRIASHFVSRLHAKVRTDEGATIIEDAGSKNGVLVNSRADPPAGPAPRRHREPRRRFQPAIRRQHALNPFGRGDLRARTA